MTLIQNTITMKKIFLAFIIAALTVPVFGQNEKVKDTDQNIILAALKGWNVRLSAGYLIGGTAPLPLPAEIRKIEGFNPGLNFMIEGDAEKKFKDTDWGVRFGLRFGDRIR